MSQGATKREQRRSAHKELLARLRILRPQPGDVFLIRVREDYFDDEERMQAAEIFAQDVQKTTGRDVFVVKEGYDLVAVPDPRQPEPAPEIARPPSGILLPTSVKLGPKPV